MNKLLHAIADAYIARPEYFYLVGASLVSSFTKAILSESFKKNHPMATGYIKATASTLLDFFAALRNIREGHVKAKELKETNSIIPKGLP